MELRIDHRVLEDLLDAASGERSVRTDTAVRDARTLLHDELVRGQSHEGSSQPSLF